MSSQVVCPADSTAEEQVAKLGAVAARHNHGFSSQLTISVHRAQGRMAAVNRDQLPSNREAAGDGVPADASTDHCARPVSLAADLPPADKRPRFS